MKYKLIKEVNPNFSALEQILYNRGIAPEDMYSYLNTTDNDVNLYTHLGENVLTKAANVLGTAIKNNKKTLIVVDCDCDGYTSAAVLINYCYKLFPAWVQNNLEWFMHDGKQHGLSDCCDWILEQNKYDLVILPDSSSNDEEYHKQLYDKGIEVIVLDHHLTDNVSKYAITINNQICDYPNKNLSGVGVVYQFCRFLDSLLNEDIADTQLDLVAIGLCGDMMSLLDKETKHLQNKGFSSEYVKNPFIYNMWQKNKYKLGAQLTHTGCAFYIVPFVNAITRSGTIEEKNIVFKSMLQSHAFEQVLSTKRGHKGETVDLVDEAILTCDRVKRRQTKEQDEGLAKIEKMIEERNLLDHKVLMFLLEPEDNISPNLRGLIANKIMAKYQRPCCILTHVIVPPWEEGEDSYQGSARGYSGSGIESFKDVCEMSEAIMYTAGHENAFGIGIAESNVEKFLEKTDDILSNTRVEIIYDVDFIYNQDNISGQDIIEVASHNELWGKDMSEPLFALNEIKITENMITLMSPEKNPTLKIQIDNISMLKFKSSQEEYESLCSAGYVKIDAIVKPNINEWNGRISPQLFIEDYDILEKVAWDF